MHETAVTESVVATVSEHVGDGYAHALTLEIGTLAGVVAAARGDGIDQWYRWLRNRLA